MMSPAPHSRGGSSGHRRRGGTVAALVATLAVAGGLTAVAIVFGPAYLAASPPAPPRPLPARVEAHQKVIDLFASLLAGSHEVLAVHPGGDGGSVEFVLWLEDKGNPGAIDEDEVAVVRHSAVMQTVAYGELEPDRERAPRVIERSDIALRSFCRIWRDRPDVRRRVLATGVERLDVQALTAGAAGRRRLWITFTWDRDSVDGPDEASVLVDLRGGGDDAGAGTLGRTE